MSSEISLSTQDFSGVGSAWGPVTGISIPLASRVGAEFGSTVPSGFSPLSGPTGATTRETNIVISLFNDVNCAVINIGFLCPDRIRWHGTAQHTHTYSHTYAVHSHICSTLTHMQHTHTYAVHSHICSTLTHMQHSHTYAVHTHSHIYRTLTHMQYTHTSAAHSHICSTLTLTHIQNTHTYAVHTHSHIYSAYTVTHIQNIHTHTHSCYCTAPAGRAKSL
jgi:hypothetical protein